MRVLRPRSPVATLNLTRLENRETPADCTWTGADDFDWNNQENWADNTKPGANDTALLSGSPVRPPTIFASENVSIKYIQLQTSATFDLTIHGTLTTKGSLIQPTAAHGFVGSGTLTLDDTPDVDVDHIWHRGYVKVPTVSVVNGAALEIRSTFGQLGPDLTTAATPSLWLIGAGTAGTLSLNGDHEVGFDELQVGKFGQVKWETTGTLHDVRRIEDFDGLFNKFLIRNQNQFSFAEGVEARLDGGYYVQQQFSDAKPVTTFNPGSSLTMTAWLGVTDGAPAYSFDVTAGKVVAYENAGISVRTDMRIEDAVLEFYSAGFFTRGAGPQQGSQLALSAKDWVAKEVLIKDTPVRFLDWNPSGRYSSSTQVEGNIAVSGNLKLDGTTELFVRADIGNAKVDHISAAMDGVTLSGNAIDLSIDLRNGTGDFGAYIPNLLYGWPLTTPDTPFNSVDLTGAIGWNVSVVKNGDHLDLNVTKQ